MRRLSILLCTAMVLAAFAPVADAAKKAKPVKAWEDPDGDADMGQGLPLGPGGFDLKEGTIEVVNKDLVFTATHHEMPPTGTLPEAFRFLWSFSIDGTTYRLTVKSADIGKPDVSQGQTTERIGRVDLQGHYRLEGDCGTTSMGINFINCKPLAYLEGEWDPSSASFSVTVPMKLVKAKKGSLVGPGTGDAISICNSQVSWVSHYVERSLSPTTCIDTAIMTEQFKIKR